MTQIARRARFYAARTRRKPKIFHIETDGAIINITVGLTEADTGRYVTYVEVLPDGKNRGGDHEGYVWFDNGDGRIIRALRGCECHEREDNPKPVLTTCLACDFRWCDRCTPAPSARCPNEYNHPA